jgi:hypothetical protein
MSDTSLSSAVSDLHYLPLPLRVARAVVGGSCPTPVAHTLCRIYLVGAADLHKRMECAFAKFSPRACLAPNRLCESTLDWAFCLQSFIASLLGANSASHSNLARARGDDDGGPATSASLWYVSSLDRAG